MGQYHVIYNPDKKEFIHAHSLDCGLKLMEQVSGDKSPAAALLLLLANSNGRGGGDAEEHPMVGRWAGDRIVVQGDYAEPTDQGFIPHEDIGGYKNISSEVQQMLDLQRW